MWLPVRTICIPGILPGMRSFWDADGMGVCLRGRSALRLLFDASCEIVDELLGGAPGDAAVAYLPLVGLQQQLLLREAEVATAAGDALHDVVVLLAVGVVVVDGAAEARRQRQLLFHRV